MNAPTTKCTVDGCGGTLSTPIGGGQPRCPFCERRKEWATKNIPGVPPQTAQVCGGPTPLASKAGKGQRRLKYCKPCKALVAIKAYRDKKLEPKPEAPSTRQKARAGR